MLTYPKSLGLDHDRLCIDNFPKTEGYICYLVQYHTRGQSHCAANGPELSDPIDIVDEG